MTALSSSCSTIAVLCVAIPTMSLAQTTKSPNDATKSHVAHAHHAADAGAVFASLDEATRRALSLQVALDRAGFSPGEIDGKPGKNTENAAEAAGRGRTTELAAHERPLITYTLSADDVAGPFVEVPDDMMAKADLPSLGYSSVLEMLGERFHMSRDLLRTLNPRARFAVGESIVVPDVEPFVAPAAKPASPSSDQPSAVTVIVTDGTKTLQVVDASGAVVFHAPVTVGSTNDPLPVGEWKVNGVSVNPTFNYNPDLFWDADPSHAKAKIPAGPNSPVGVVWIDLSKEHYGIHGTPEPSRIAYSESHGCIRLTNWDAMRLAALVAPGTKVILQ